MEQLADNIRATGYVVQDVKLIGIEEGVINISKRHSSRLSSMDRLLPILFFIEKNFMLQKYQERSWYFMIYHLIF